MVRRRATPNKRSKRQSPVKRSRKTRKTSPSLKEKLLTTAIWALSLVNLVLIFSLISNFFKSPDETTVSIGSAARVSAVVANDKITVQVLNACGVQGLANDVTKYLREHDFDVVDFGNYPGGFVLDKTLIFDRVSLNTENALRVAEVLNIDKKQVVSELDNSLQLSVTVMVGKDYKKLSLFSTK